MHARIFSFLPLRDVLRQGAGANGLFANFVPGIPTTGGVIGGRDGANVERRSGFGELQSQYYVWRNLLPGLDHVGFETAQRPLFIDPMRPERLRAEFPDVFALRQTWLGDWRASSLQASQATLSQLHAMRAALTAADTARIERWLSRLDVVIPQPMLDAATEPRRSARFAYGWGKFATIARRHGIFRDIPECFDDAVPHWPAHNSYILRASLFEELIAPSFAALFAFQDDEPGLGRHDIRLYAERLVGHFLYAAILRNPLLRVAYLPLVVAPPDIAPVRVPDGFDPSTYLALNPDIGTRDAAAHYLAQGWREQRDWTI